jgi:retron-type reverse transcriptase
MGEMSTKELQIAERSRNHKQEALTNLHQYIDEELLHNSYQSLNKNSSPGVDGKYWHNYSLESRFRIPGLLSEFKSGKYKAPNIRRVYISKGKTGTRPLGIPKLLSYYMSSQFVLGMFSNIPI